MTTPPMTTEQKLTAAQRFQDRNRGYSAGYAGKALPLTSSVEFRQAYRRGKEARAAHEKETP